MRVAAWILLLTLTGLLTYAGYAIAEVVAGAVTQTDLLGYLLNPQTGMITLMAVLLVYGGRLLKEKDAQLKEINEKVQDVLLTQREYFERVESKRHESELATRAVLERVAVALERRES
jgi:hypothetical protein